MSDELWCPELDKPFTGGFSRKYVCYERRLVTTVFPLWKVVPIPVRAAKLRYMYSMGCTYQVYLPVHLRLTVGP